MCFRSSLYIIYDDNITALFQLLGELFLTPSLIKKINLLNSECLTIKAEFNFARFS